MESMQLHLRNGEVIFHCAGCARDFFVDRTKPFVAQLRSISYEHYCPSRVPAEQHVAVKDLLDVTSPRDASPAPSVRQ
jgi:hypothetical protein